MLIAVAAILFVLAFMKLVSAIVFESTGLSWMLVVLAAANILAGVLNIAVPSEGIGIAVGIYVCVLAFVSLIGAVISFIGGVVERNAGFLFLPGFFLLVVTGALTPLGILQIIQST